MKKPDGSGRHCNKQHSIDVSPTHCMPVVVFARALLIVLGRLKGAT